MKSLALALAAVMLAGPAFAENDNKHVAQPAQTAPTEPQVVTPSGHPEATFASTTVDDVRNRILDACATHAFNIYQSDSNQVVCGKQMQGFDAVMGQFLLGNSYSTTPENKARFTIIQRGADVRVVVFQWYETQMALGQVRQQELNNRDAFNNAMKFLHSIGGQT